MLYPRIAMRSNDCVVFAFWEYVVNDNPEVIMNFDDKLHEEILQTIERRSRIDMTKLTFLTTLFGIGTIGKIDIPGGAMGATDITLFGTLYIAPFVALVCDCFILRELWSVRRIGHFLSKHGCPDEQDFECAIKSRRNPFYKYGFSGLSLLTIAIAVWMLAVQKGGIGMLNMSDTAWVIVSIIGWLFVDVRGYRLLKQTFDTKASSREPFFFREYGDAHDKPPRPLRRDAF